MKFRFFTVMALALLSVISTARADIQWETDYASANARSRLSGKPMLIDFYTDWCGWCTKMDTDTYPNPTVQAMAQKFIMVKLNAEKGGKAAAQQFQVKGYPNIMCISSQGKTLYGNAGYHDVNDFTQAMQYMLQKDEAEKGVAAPAMGAPAPIAGQNAMTQQQAVLRKLGISMAGQSSRPRTLKMTSTGSRPATYLDRKVKVTNMGGGVLLLDESGPVVVAAPKKAVRVAAKAAKKTKKAKARRVRN